MRCVQFGQLVLAKAVSPLVIWLIVLPLLVFAVFISAPIRLAMGAVELSTKATKLLSSQTQEKASGCETPKSASAAEAGRSSISPAAIFLIQLSDTHARTMAQLYHQLLSSNSRLLDN